MDKITSDFEFKLVKVYISFSELALVMQMAAHVKFLN